MTSLHFQDPWWLLLLAPLAILVISTLRRKKRPAVVFSDVSLLRAMPRTLAERIKPFVPWALYVGMALLVVALARPQKGLEHFRIQAEGIAMEMCIDRSGSMRAMDFKLDGQRINRLEVVKRVFKNFVDGGRGLAGRANDLIGLVAFGGYVDAMCPLTLDHGALGDVLDAVKIPQPIIDSHGNVVNEEEQLTAIGDAVVTAVDRLKDIKAKSKIVILLSDGRSNAGAVDPTAAVEAAKANNIKIYTIGVGSNGVAPFEATDPFGNKVLVNRPVDYDENTLRMIANETGGRYFNARDTESLKNVYADIDKLEKTKSEGSLYTEYRDWYRYFLLSGLFLVLIHVTLISTRFRSLP